MDAAGGKARMMMDIQTVIDNLEQNIRWIEDFPVHQFPGWGNVTMAMRDAVELLKEKSLKPIWLHGEANCGNCLLVFAKNDEKTIHYCPSCGVRIDWRNCGQEVKQE